MSNQFIFLFMLVSAASLEKRDWLAKAILETRAAASFPSIRPHYHSLLPPSKQMPKKRRIKKSTKNAKCRLCCPDLHKTIVSSPQRMQKWNIECKISTMPSPSVYMPLYMAYRPCLKIPKEWKNEELSSSPPPKKSAWCRSLILEANGNQVVLVLVKF